MAKQLKIKEEVEMEAMVRMFYSELGLPDDYVKKKVDQYYEYVHRVKGTNVLTESVVNYILDESFWIGIWIANQHPDLVSVEDIPDEEVEDEEQIKLVGPNIKTLDKFDPSFG